MLHFFCSYFKIDINHMDSLAKYTITKKHILIVDDDEGIRVLLKQYLEKYNYRVTTAANALDSRALIKNFTFDLLILDIMMPGESGLSLTDFLTKTYTTPIILLTALADTSDKIKGLEFGAADYLVKPFEPRELVLRIEAIIKRNGNWSDKNRMHQVSTFGQLVYHGERDELSDGKKLISLSPTESLLLKILVENSNRVISREELNNEFIKSAQKKIAFKNRSIDVVIARLRQKIEMDPKTPRYLKTIRGVGYILTPN